MDMVLAMVTTADTIHIIMALRPDGIMGARSVGRVGVARPASGNRAAAEVAGSSRSAAWKRAAHRGEETKVTSAVSISIDVPA
jgi:hypothetical protein